MVNLENGTAFITGSGSGMGRAMATELAAAGTTVVIADIDTDGAEETLSQVKDDGGTGTIVEVDVTDRESVEAGVDDALDKYGTIDILCNNAGILDDYSPVLETDESLWDGVIDINLKGVYNVTKEVLPQMQNNGGGAIVNTASIAGKVAGGGGAAYTSSKHGVIGFTKQLAHDYGPEIRPNAVCPGFIKTGMTQHIIDETPDEVQDIVEGTPAERYAEPKEVAQVVRFLASDEASFMYGSAVDVDGGWLVG